MQYDNAPIRKLAKTSLRLNILLICFVSIAIVLVGTCYWALWRLAEEDNEKVNFHFSRLIGDIREHENFLTRVARQSDEAVQLLDHHVIPWQQKILYKNDSFSVFEGREFSIAMPFTVAIPNAPQKEVNDTSKGLFSLGVLLADFYSSYWATSKYPAAQAIILDLNSDVSLAVPSIDSFPGHVALSQITYDQVIARVLGRIKVQPPTKDGKYVQWSGAERITQDVSGTELMAYISADIPDALWLANDQKRHVIAVSLLDLARINDYTQVLDRAIFDEMELRTPKGEVLVGKIGGVENLKEGLNLTARGMLVKVESSEGWVGYYLIGFKSFLRYSGWQLLSFFTLLLVSVLGSILLFRWYSLKVVAPAKKAHHYIVESDSFSRKVIQSVPIALCVIRRDDGKVVLENRLALEWLGDRSDIAELSRELIVDSDGEPLVGDREVYADIKGRSLRIVCVPARYKGADVTLCTFNDITAHKQVEAALAAAKRNSDAASEAKTIFLATMSHEIRTPLYGVLGTLELLGLTPLTSLQRGYFETIQRSSSTLLQLISDVLDVSKIESGQMALESVEFSPIDMIEDLMQSYSASAQAKGIQAYFNIDTNVPGIVCGDAFRIRQILSNILSNAIKFTDVGRVALRLKAVLMDTGLVTLQWQITDTGIGISQEQQVQLFERFYQAHGQSHTISGTGLGLSICQHLSHLMNGSLKVVSETGLGSSFTFSLSLGVISNELSKEEDFKLRPDMIFVRAPFKELADSVCGWISHWGGRAVSVGETPESNDTSIVLVDILSDYLPPITWPGKIISCVSIGQVYPQHAASGWMVGMHSLKAIGRALTLVQGGYLLPEPNSNKTILKWGDLGLKVLVAEDNPINQVLLKEQLQELGCTVTLCANGIDALQCWRNSVYDVLLTDLNMPFMDGCELVSEIRKQDTRLPIIGVTANAMREEGERCMAAGMTAWVVKPISLTNLYECLRGVCDRSEVSTNCNERLIDNYPADMDEDVINVSERMRPLFLQTMSDDVKTAKTALKDGDGKSARLMLHRIRGALAVVQAHSLVALCAVAEEKICGETMSADLTVYVDGVLDQILIALGRV
ncbi:response regulator [Pseudomonas fragi]|uniref:hybrid sensor histidine kinase/response regulator n=1 Tax=Pseudomonas fragi TaxID=296 RepID=UPI0021BF6DD5|nr:hybrid sensor histidine kinase/response regulator [Pseudomonas fragi]UXL37070.1 response regulator [Pseudomonas fragi]